MRAAGVVTQPASGEGPEAAARLALSWIDLRRIVASGFLGLSGGRLAAGLMSWLWLIIAARALPLEQFGDLALLLSLGAVFSVAADLGLPLVLMRVTAERPETAFSAVVVAIRRRVIAGVVAVAAVAVAFNVTASRPSVLLPALFGVSVLSTAVHTSVAAALRGLGRPRAEVVNEVVSRLSVLVVGGWWVSRGGGLVAAVATYAAADAVSAVALWAVARRLPGRQDASAADLSIRRTGPLALAGILGTLYYRIDLWMLAMMTNSRALALYAAAYRLLDGLLIPTGALSALMIPLTTSLSSRERLAFGDRIVRSGSVLAAVAGIVAIVAAPWVLASTFGADYGPASGTLRILLLGLVPSVAVLVLAPMAAIADRRGFARIVGGALLLNVAAIVALVPSLGAQGAAWATLVSQCLLAVRLRRQLGRLVRNGGDDA